ncbi:glycosyltransferase, partial [Tateyamaria omphalii]|uniref:glycosyltransferase n=1 Tax=Tateyamaria omphalii TaxID=299262 RepID=UPI001E40A825
RVQQIPAGCDRSRFFSDPDAARDLGHRFQLRDGVFTVLTCSRLAPRKGHADLFQALRLSKLRADWIIAGGGSWRNGARLWRDTWSLWSGPRLRVRRVGHVDDRTLRGLFHRADVFALTPIERMQGTRLDSEGYGLVYLEANACGCPALATRSGGCADAVLDGVTGYLAEPGDPVSIAGALQRFAAAPDAGVAMGAAGQARVDAFDGWRAATAAVRNHLAKIVDAPALRMASNV